MVPDYTILDNPAWHSLLEADREFSIGYGNINFYDPQFCAFGGFDDPRHVADQIGEYAKLVNDFYIIGEKPPLPKQLTITKELVCLQMVLKIPVSIPIKEEIIPLSAENADEVYDLVSLVQPGYFQRKTFMLGNYYGIFKERRLVALTGERMKTTVFTELSAIVTHPDHTGNGYAKQLIGHATGNIFAGGKLPYLHVAESNLSATKIYEKLGFTTRRKMSFWHISK